MQLRFAVPEDRPALSALWITCFPGDEDFRDYFMEEIFAPSNTYVMEEDGRILSMAHMLPMDMEYHGNRVPAAYVFAVGTEPDYRGRGIAGQVLDEIYRELRRREIPLVFLVPQKDGLFDYYRRFGFAEVFHLCFDRLVLQKIPQEPRLKDYTLERRFPTDGEIAAADGIFEKVMKYRDHLLRDPLHWKRAVRIGEIAGGGMFLLHTAEGLAGYAICEWVADDLLVNELLAEDEASFHTLCAGVLERMGAAEATMLCTACPHDAKRFGMARVIDAERMLAYAASYRDMDCAFDVVDKRAPWNTGHFEIRGKEIIRTEYAGGNAYLTPEQLTGILYGAGPMPYINLLFS